MTSDNTNLPKMRGDGQKEKKSYSSMQFIPTVHFCEYVCE